uniref:Uncharacterized protein n=1 Tax=Siphoviridae sp. ctMBu2 TaxID=2827853 RepID=A0A8S5T4I1_9CAUD|nr:MAG TPA: hypothetical protein [Siphoviridae sp. ctMBu2]
MLRFPMIARFLRRGQFLVILDCGVVIGLAATWADFPIDSAVFPGILAGFQFVRHKVSYNTATLRRFLIGGSLGFFKPLAPAGAFLYSGFTTYTKRLPHPTTLRFFCIRAPSFVSHGYRISPSLWRV